MRILLICCNFGNIRDAIGVGASKLYNLLSASPETENVIYENADTADMNRLGWIFSLRMTRAILRAAKKIKPQGITHVLVEYPFQEYNPAIIPAFGVLAAECRKNGTKLCMSLHEYLRAKKLRRMVVENFAKKSDIVFVSDKPTEDALRAFAGKIVIRSIAAGICPVKSIDLNAKTDDFIYFGLVNRSKAFAEMLEAWKIFNADGRYRLRILTSTDISRYEPFDNSITIYRDLPEDQVAEHFAQCGYAIAPIVPFVFAGNSSFKTAAAFGCICTGSFSDSFPAPEFAVTTDSYDPAVFAEALRTAVGISEEERLQKMKAAMEFGANFRPEKMAETILKELKELI